MDRKVGTMVNENGDNAEHRRTEMGQRGEEVAKGKADDGGS